ncbi:MAG: DMT family transporter [Clostridia bacterium]|nr:DMT family transporter [Clostridia bacterium]
MKRNWIRQVVYPLLAAMIWGTAFVFQSVSTEFVGPFTFTMLRSAIGVAFLGLLLLGRSLLVRCGVMKGQGKRDVKALLLGGFLCGTVLTVATNLQQVGLHYGTTAGKSAFLTALYVVLVPLVGLLLFRRRESPALWISIVLAVGGLYFLCITEGEKMIAGDIFTLLCAVAFTAHIMVIDRFGARVDGVELSCVQFVVVALWSALGMLLTEQPTLEAIGACIGPILYVGIFSSGVAYTLQILAQKGSNPTVVSLLLCLESVFATVATVLMLGQWMSTRETVGSVLMLIAVLLAQIPSDAWRRVFKRGVKQE